METTQQFTVGQRVDGFEALKALPVGTRLTLGTYSNADNCWITNGDEATRYRLGDESGEGVTNLWDHSGWVSSGWVIEALPERFVVGQKIDDWETLKALPVGTRLIRPGPFGSPELHWITNWDEATRYRVEGEPEQTYRWGTGGWVSDGWEIAALPTPEPEPSVLKVGDRVKISDPAYTNDSGLVQPEFYGKVGTVTDTSDATKPGLGYRVRIEAGERPLVDDHNWISGDYLTLVRFHVGYEVHTVEECDALPVGTRMTLVDGHIVRTKQAAGDWDYMGGKERAETLSLHTGYVITHLPGTEAAEPPPVDDGPQSMETVRQFKARFRSLALSASFGSSIEMEPVYRYLGEGDFYEEATTIGLPVYGFDHDTFMRLPEGTVLKQEDPDDPGLWITDGSEEINHLHGSDHRDAFTLFRVSYLPGSDSSSWASTWVNEAMTAEEARAAHRQIEDLKLLIWDLGNKGRDESEDAGDRWCNVFEQTLAEVGIDESFARGKGWTAPTRTEEISVTIRVDGVTLDGHDMDYARDMIGSSGPTIDDFDQARVTWTWHHNIHGVEVEEQHCACEGWNDEEAIKALLDGAGINYSSFTFNVTCDNG